MEQRDQRPETPGMFDRDRKTWVIILNGQTLYRTQYEQVADLMCIGLRRDGWGMCYVEAE